MPDRTDTTAHTRISLSRPTWAALIAAFLIVTALLTLTTVTLISQRQKTVVLNKQLGTLVAETTVALHGVTPLLGAVPAHSTTIRSRADSLAHLVSAARPLVGQLTAGDLPTTLDNVSGLAASVNRAALVARFGELLDELPAASALITKLTSLAAAAQGYHLVPRAAQGLHDIGVLVRVQTRALRVAQATLENGRSARSIAQRSLTTAQATLSAARQILTVAQQTLAHAASLDRKVGPVP
jgi:hypothetical protein